MPHCSIREPASMKKGMAIREKESIAVNIFWGIMRPGKAGSKNSVITAEILMA